MNLAWLKYVSYASLVGAAFFYMALRLNWQTVSRRAKLLGYAVCIALACVAWHVQESNADQHSPRRLVVGTVTSVSASANKSGSIDDDFQIRIDGGALSPKFSTDVVASSRSQQPIHVGDTLGVLYRMWDDVPLTIDELQGQRQGWHYRRYQALSPFVWTVAIAGTFGLLGAAVSSRKRESVPAVPESTLDQRST